MGRSVEMAMGLMSTVAALDVWSDLEDAFRGVNGFGGDTAEIYAFRLIGHRCPGSPLTFGEDYALRAGAALRALCRYFEEIRECRVVIDGVPLDRLDPAFGFVHRVHVQVRTEVADSERR